jgi:hypothetical protein
MLGFLIETSVSFMGFAISSSVSPPLRKDAPGIKGRIQGLQADPKSHQAGPSSVPGMQDHSGRQYKVSDPVESALHHSPHLLQRQQPGTVR